MDAVGEINCGEPALEEANLLYRTSLPTAVFGKGPFYILKAKGDSMVDAGIEAGDTLVIRKNAEPKLGDIVVAMHWQHYFNHVVKKYSGIYKLQLPNITAHVCRHTFCSKMAKSGMNPKTLQYIMGHSDISVTMNTDTHFTGEDAREEFQKLFGDEESVQRRKMSW